MELFVGVLAGAAFMILLAMALKAIGKPEDAENDDDEGTVPELHLQQLVDIQLRQEPLRRLTDREVDILAHNHDRLEAKKRTLRNERFAEEVCESGKHSRQSIKERVQLLQETAKNGVQDAVQMCAASS